MQFHLVNDEAWAIISSTTYFVACVLNATTSTLYLPMEDGKITGTQIFPNNSESDSWTI